MKRAILLYRLPHLLLGGLITGLLVASAVVLPTTPAQAADRYLIDESVSEDLSFKSVGYVAEKEDLAETYETEDSKELCEKLKADDRESYQNDAEFYRNELGITHMQLDNCIFVDSLVFTEYSGKYDEDLLKKISSESANKINENGELIWRIDRPAKGWDFGLGSTRVRNNIGIMRYRFPGKIKNLNPKAGKISGNTWTLDDPPTGEEADNIANNKGTIIITAELHGSKSGLILGITIPAALIIAVVIVLLIVRSKRKKKQQNLPPYPTGSSTYPPSPFMPGNSPHPVRSQAREFPAAPAAPGIPRATQPPRRAPQAPRPGVAGISPGQPPMPGNTRLPMPGASPQAGYPPQYGHFPAPPYPPNAPQGQPGAATPGGYYPYLYPPANPQNTAGWQPPIPNQGYGYGAPTPGFPPPQTPSGSTQPRAAAASKPPEQPSGPKHAAYSPKPGRSGEPGKPE